MLYLFIYLLQNHDRPAVDDGEFNLLVLVSCDPDDLNYMLYISRVVCVHIIISPALGKGHKAMKRLTSVCLKRLTSVCLSRTSGHSPEQRGPGRLKLAQR